MSRSETARKNLAETRTDSLIASIDMGSHTTRMLIGRLRGLEITPVCVERRITRLARGFDQREEITQASQEENLSALREYCRKLGTFGVHSIACGATGVLRRAKNAAAVLGRVQAETGIQPVLISEENEALLSAKGILSALPDRRGDFLLFDLGGGSTELLFVRSGMESPLWATSLFVGAATATGRYLSGDPPPPHVIANAEDAIREVIRTGLEPLKKALADDGASTPAFRAVGTAGTVTTLAAMYLEMTEYVPYRVNGLDLPGDWLAETVKGLAGASFAERCKIPGLEPGREDIILGGAMIVSAILDVLGLDRLTVTDGGFLEGLLLNLAEEKLELPRRLTTSLTWRP